MKSRIQNILLEAITFKDRPNINDMFWKWFGSSKIVDDSGDPLICYHGTVEDFSEFDLKRGANKIWFGVSSRLASQYAESGVATSVGANVIPFYVRMINPAVFDESKKWVDVSDEILKKRGHDGVLFSPNNRNKTGYVFKSSQIKSIFNKGTWDINNSDITE